MKNASDPLPQGPRRFLEQFYTLSRPDGGFALQTSDRIRLSYGQFPKHTFPPFQALRSWKCLPSLRRSLQFSGTDFAVCW